MSWSHIFIILKMPLFFAAATLDLTGQKNYHY
jgi:hypothetical protein